MLAIKNTSGILLAATLLFPALSQAMEAFPSGTENLPYTQLKIFAPWGYPPALAKTLKILQQTSGSCWAPSIADPRPDAWRCTIGNAIQDPCFSNFAGPGATEVACIKSPWAKEVTIIKLNKPLPKIANAPSYLAKTPWAIELANGTHCVYEMTGTIPMIAGWTSSAVCFDAHGKVTADLAFNQIDRNLPLWRVLFQAADNPTTLAQLPIQAAWY